MDYNPIVADVDHWIRNNCASWSTEAVICALVQLGYMSTTQVVEWLQENELKNGENTPIHKQLPYWNY